MKRGGKKLLIVLAVVLAVLGGAAGFYLLRPPLVLVVDAPFLALYGPKRAEARRYILSATLLRRVAFAVAAQDGDQNVAEFAINEVSEKPFMVLFPERYLDSADRYASAAEAAGLSESVRTAVIESGNGREASIGHAESLRIDRETDLYRAGMCATIIAKEAGIVVYSQDTLSQANRKAFTDGAVAAGYVGTPRFARSNDQSPPEGTGCAVFLSAVNANLLAAQQNIPIILFSWMDPNYTPNGVAIVFDDSLPAVAEQAVQGNNPLTAYPHILSKRLQVPDDLKALRVAISAKREE
ncbi:MAG: hypothetical protein LBK61_07135 [Spirochaetaceae bacterium]|jgi:hypothetical protein|nr:hypothetical protein [Spirochaetaceae bacterium]